MSENVKSEHGEQQFMLLVVGLACVGAMAAVAMVAISNGWLTAVTGAGFLGLGTWARMKEVPRALVLVTYTFGVALVLLGGVLVVN